MNIIDLTPEQLRKAADLKEQIANLQKQLAQLTGTVAAASAKATAPNKARFSAATLAKMRRAQQKRWARVRAQKGGSTTPVSTQRPATESVNNAKSGRRKRSGNGMTTAEAILKALEGGKLAVSGIISKVTSLKGKVSKLTVSQSLVQLKKDGKISNPARGQYTLKQ